MAAIDRLLHTWMASGRDEEIEGTVLGKYQYVRETILMTNAAPIPEVSASRNGLLDVVKALGEFLTSEDDHLRTKGTFETFRVMIRPFTSQTQGVEFLSAVLERCPPESITRQAGAQLYFWICLVVISVKLVS
jgi:DNA repair/transcription protein MET18/MMS19